MGFLHVEMMSQECGGKVLAGSGWDHMLPLANVFTTGIAASLLAGKHVKCTWYAYQLTLAWLYVYSKHRHMMSTATRAMGLMNTWKCGSSDS